MLSKGRESKCTAVQKIALASVRQQVDPEATTKKIATPGLQGARKQNYYRSSKKFRPGHGERKRGAFACCMDID